MGRKLASVVILAICGVISYGFTLAALTGGVFLASISSLR
jgi:hypothetical protein